MRQRYENVRDRIANAAVASMMLVTLAGAWVSYLELNRAMPACTEADGPDIRIWHVDDAAGGLIHRGLAALGLVPGDDEEASVLAASRGPC